MFSDEPRSELASVPTLARDLYDQFPKLTSPFHIAKQAINPLDVIDTPYRPRDDWPQFFSFHEIDHIFELLSRTHRGALDLDVLQDRLHGERHPWSKGHAVGDYHSTGLPTSHHRRQLLSISDSLPTRIGLTFKILTPFSTTSPPAPSTIASKSPSPPPTPSPSLTSPNKLLSHPSSL